MSLGRQDSPLPNGQGRICLQHLGSCTGVWVSKTSPFANGHERSGFQHLESCTGFWVGNTPLLLMVRREVVSNIWSHALEFGWVRLPPC